jgi:hypothetical protein
VAEGDGETASTPRPVARCSRRRQSALYIRIRVGAGGVRRLRGAHGGIVRGVSALYAAAYAGHLAVVAELLDRGADVPDATAEHLVSDFRGTVCTVKALFPP